jgi:hypothetical protein
MDDRQQWAPRTPERCVEADPRAVELRGPCVAPERNPKRGMTGGGQWVRPRSRGGVMSELMLDRAGRRRSPATMPGFHTGQAPGNKGHRYPADPPKVEENGRRHARGGRPARPTDARADRNPLASRASYPRSARADRRRSRRSPQSTARAARQGRSPARGRHGRVGVATVAAVARAATRAASRPAVVRDRGGRAGAIGLQPPHALSFAASPRPPACVVASPRTSYAMRTRWRWPGKACH